MRGRRRHPGLTKEALITPFQVLRLWIRRAPLGERVAAGLASALVVSLLAWVLVPVLPGPVTATDSLGVQPQGGPVASASTPADAGSTAAAPGSPARGAAGVPAPVTAATGAPRGGGATAPGTIARPGPSAPSGKTCPGGSGTGLTASRIKLAVLLVSIAGPAGNGAFGVPPPEAQKSYYQAALDEQNARGGVACRQLAAQYYEVNPADQGDLQRTCLAVSSGGFFAVLDAGVYAQFPLLDCYAQHKVPYFGSYLLSAQQQRAGYPYLFNFNLLDTVYRDAIFALRDRGFFKPANGFAKLGFIYHDCDRSLVDRFKGWTQQAGVTSSRLVAYSVGCPTALASPSVMQQAILKFKQEGVTHLTSLGFVGDFASFSRLAEQQGFRPKYGLADDAIVALSYGTQRPDANNIDGAIAITGSRTGENTTPGSKPTAGTARCDAAFKKKGIGPTYSLPSGAGNACSNVWMFAAAAERAGSLRGDALAAGLQAAGSVELSYPEGPSDFRTPGTTTAGQYWRPLQFRKSCRCWQVIDRTFHRTFA